jgi:aminoglycoside 2'-N-acetyltransferase I
VVRTAHTADLAAKTLATVRALLDEAFHGGFEDHDWEHALGGVHALAYEGDELVGHGSVTMRRLLHGGRTLRAGYVEGVGVRPGARRRGHGGALMETLARIIRGAYELGALSATDEAIPLYERHGWRRWDGPLFALTPAGRVRTAEYEAAVYVLELGAALDRSGELTCDWRDGDVW